MGDRPADHNWAAQATTRAQTALLTNLQPPRQADKPFDLAQDMLRRAVSQPVLPCAAQRQRQPPADPRQRDHRPLPTLTKENPPEIAQLGGSAARTVGRRTRPTPTERNLPLPTRNRHAEQTSSAADATNLPTPRAAQRDVLPPCGSRLKTPLAQYHFT